jgi:hypothetical protein
MNYYYADRNNQTQGPVPETDLREMYQRGVISYDSFVIGEGESDWKPYRAIGAPAPPPLGAIAIRHEPIRTIQMESITLVPEVKTQRCPFCAEDINVAAKKCKHCGETLDVALRAAEEAKRAHVNQPMVFMNAVGGGPQQKQSFPHLMHFFLTLFTGGLWLFVWIFHYMFRSRHKYY